MCETITAGGIPTTGSVKTNSNLWFSYLPSTRPNRYKIEYNGAGTAVSVMWTDASYYDYNEKTGVARFYDANGQPILLVVNVVSVLLEAAYITVGDPPPCYPTWIPYKYEPYVYPITTWTANGTSYESGGTP